MFDKLKGFISRKEAAPMAEPPKAPAPQVSRQVIPGCYEGPSELLGESSSGENFRNWLGRVFPEIPIVHFAGGQSIDLWVSGEPTLIFFHKHGSPMSSRGLITMRELLNKLHLLGITIRLIDLDLVAGDRTVHEATCQKWYFPYLCAITGELPLECLEVPLSFLLNGDGRVVAIHEGATSMPHLDASLAHLQDHQGLADAGAPAPRKIESLRSHNEIIDRALCLMGLVNRSHLENSLVFGEVDRARVIGQGYLLRAWLNEEGISSGFSPEERKFMDREVGSWQEEETLLQNWRSEALIVLLWTLEKMHTMPAYGSRALPAEYRPMMCLQQSSKTWRKQILKTLSPQRVNRERELAELWLWRCRTSKLKSDGLEVAAGHSYEEVVRRAVSISRSRGVIYCPGDDLMVKAIPFGKLSDSSFKAAHASTKERSRTFNWLCGSGAWDDACSSKAVRFAGLQV